MSSLSDRMASLTGGNAAPAALLRQAFSPPDSDSGSTARTETSPPLETFPELA